MQKSHGTAPLDWNMRVCSLAVVPSVRIRGKTQLNSRLCQPAGSSMIVQTDQKHRVTSSLILKRILFVPSRPVPSRPVPFSSVQFRSVLNAASHDSHTCNLATRSLSSPFLHAQRVLLMSRSDTSTVLMPPTFELYLRMLVKQSNARAS